MKIILNGEEKILQKQATIKNLVDEYQLDTRKIAIERNLEIVPQSDFANIEVVEGDNIEIIHFIGGG